ncbi:universal stress protein [Salinadaptatus halalkaliphilus]|uniref:Universal stress protein n=1 Tax=Salinadaptatus halalkaliphilus TaxID=2419781 RepID=A0A4S3TPT4_9EURY|nr:universal stress protein [Salinadaptatus halalkaliphilus]THE66352.1 universal stress protein [Salinadaptatus halalkaliphilus]
MYQDLLLATDGSDGARQATQHAIELATRLESRLHVVSVAEEGPHSSSKRDEMRADEEGDAEAAVAETERLAEDHGIATTTTVLEGVPQEEIVAFAQRGSIDMIVVGTVGRTGVDHLLLGSVAEEVVRNAPVPVVTVRADE